MSKPRVCMLAADGLDPYILIHLVEEGQLPHFRRLMARGFFAPMITTYPPVSPVAWTSLLTGCWPAKHGILDFI
ncbi:MAG: alkaline phosphatase family protein, partial [Anaerolineae bacterium]|nr:alkaline phosphatase family protein [Anaerolineae bacterium]